MGDSFDADGEVEPNRNLTDEIVLGVADRQTDIDDVISGALSNYGDWTDLNSFFVPYSNLVLMN